MALAASGKDSASTLRLSPDAIPEHDQVAAWRELYGPQILRLEVKPLSDVRFSPDLKLQMLPDQGIITGMNSPVRVGRSQELPADGDDGLTLRISREPGIAAYLGQDVAAGASDAVVLSSSDLGDFTFPSASEVVALRLRRSALRPLLPDIDAVMARPVPRSMPALRLLLCYLQVLRDRQPPADPELERLAMAYVYNLLAIVFGPARDAAGNARGRGARAAMLQAAKAAILANLHHGDLSVDEIAAQCGLTPRNLQRLFEGEGTTFTDVMLGQRLRQAHRMLSDSRCTRSVTSVAFESGFNDLSYFNRTFRRQFGCTPSEVRDGST